MSFPEAVGSEGITQEMSISSLLGAAGNGWYGDIIWAAAEAAAEGRNTSLEDIRRRQIISGAIRVNRTAEEFVRSVSLDETRAAAEFMKQTGLLERTPEGDYRVSETTVNNWGVFVDSYSFWNYGQKPLASVLVRMEGKV